MRRWFGSALLVTLALAVAACEPLDTGSGGGAGGRLALIRGGALVVSTDTGDDERTLTDQSTSADPALSPNGTSVVFAHNASGAQDGRSITLVAFEGSTLTTLAEPGAGESFGAPTFSPDGQTVYFVSQNGSATRLMKVSLDGGDAERVASTEGFDHPAFLNASTLLVRDSSGEVKSFDLTMGSASALGFSAADRVAVSPGGASVAYAKGGVIAVRSLATGNEVTLATTGFGDRRPAFSPDGLQVAFEAQGPSEQQPKLYAASVDGLGSATLLQVGGSAAWGP
jgi:TolB protein